MSFYGDKIRISVFGESHGEAIGTVIEGLPAGFRIDMEKLGDFLKRRAPGGKYTTKRKEADEPKFISGLMDGVTTGAPLTALIYNTNTRSGDYAKLKEIPRPSHADYPAYVKFGGFCLETQNWPDAVNQPEFPSAVITPEKPYSSRTVWAFDTI